MTVSVIHTHRLVSSEVFGRKFPEIYFNFSGNFQKFVKYFFILYILIIIICFQVYHLKMMQ